MQQDCLEQALPLLLTVLIGNSFLPAVSVCQLKVCQYTGYLFSRYYFRNLRWQKSESYSGYSSQKQS